MTGPISQVKHNRPKEDVSQNSGGVPAVASVPPHTHRRTAFEHKTTTRL
jgi:hypothetical protein